MLLSSSHSQFYEKYKSTETVIDLMADAGFDAIDLSFDASADYYGENTDGEAGKARFLEWRKRAEARGLVFNQAHAPSGSSFRDNMEATVARFHDIRRAIRNASYLGVPTIVVHPVQHLPYCEPGVPEQLFEWNMQFYRALLPYCEEYGVKVAIENMWQKPNGIISHSTCSRPEEFIRYVDTLDSEWFVACLDIGHATLVRVDPCELIRALGKNRLKALHVHDVDGINDLHTIPYLSKINWDSVCDALREIDYEGDFTFEVPYFFKPLPTELVAPGAKYLAATGRHLIDKIKDSE